MKTDFHWPPNIVSVHNATLMGSERGHLTFDREAVYWSHELTSQPIGRMHAPNENNTPMAYPAQTVYSYGR